jgi:hypothetical protein
MHGNRLRLSTLVCATIIGGGQKIDESTTKWVGAFAV